MRRVVLGWSWGSLTTDVFTPIPRRAVSAPLPIAQMSPEAPKGRLAGSEVPS